METKLKKLLDKIYELEGLVALSISRSHIPDNLLNLISEKGVEVGNLCSSLNVKDNVLNERPREETSFIKEDENHDISDNQKAAAISVAVANAPDFNLDEYFIEEESESSHENVEPEEDSFNDNFENKVEEKKGRLVFSINNRFRFKKELFNNSDVDFNNTLALVASMENYEEAEDYFLNEVGFNRDDSVVTDFLEIIKRYFK
ncbi:MAG: hypothetical protein J1F38_07375 [Muribaculaceae bacterium]|nr:hypothetical protein [Muribaculaceae bacterium]